MCNEEKDENICAILIYDQRGKKQLPAQTGAVQHIILPFKEMLSDNVLIIPTADIVCHVTAHSYACEIAIKYFTD